MGGDGKKEGPATHDGRGPMNKRLHLVRDLLAWCKTRAGYVETLH